MNRYVINQPMLEKLGNYLASRPWIEVRELMAVLMALRPMEAPAPEAPAPEPPTDPVKVA